MFTVNPANPVPISAGIYAAGQTLTVAVSGSTNLNYPASQIVVNPDGSLVAPIASAECTACWQPGYQIFIPGAQYPMVAGGDGINHFAGGGSNYDLLSDDRSPWAGQGKQTTDTTDLAAIRFGTLAYTFADNPAPLDWHTLGFGGTVQTGSGGNLQLVIVDTYYPNNSGGYTVDINVAEVPEPGTLSLLCAGLCLMTINFRRVATYIRSRIPGAHNGCENISS